MAIQASKRSIVDDVEGHGMKNQLSQTISRLWMFAHSGHGLVKSKKLQ